jgi:hypothetical protein
VSFLKKMFGGDQTDSGGDTPVNTRDPDVMIKRLMDCKPGDSISYMSRRWTITGWLDYDEGGYRWRELHLSGDDDEFASLSLDPKGDPKSIIWQYDDHLDPNPGAPQVDIDGVTFRSNSHGTASFRATGTVDAPDSGMIEYYDYHLHDRARMVCFERCNDHSWESYKGERVELEYVSISEAP